MVSVASVTVNIFLFISLYVQIFLIITLFEYYNRGKKLSGIEEMDFDERYAPGTDYPSIAVIVPCFNEEATVLGTIESLKNMNYPADKLSIIAVDDGSTDDTWSYLEQFRNDPRVKIFKKENGGKHTAVNFGIENSISDLISCLDADSFVHPDALLRMLPYFSDPKIMSVTPAIKVRTPKNVLEYIQYAEYNIGIFLRKMYSTFNGIHVTPGPFSVFRREVFTIVGKFKSAYNTEDLEFALRLHSYNLKIENSHTSYVFTTPPSTVRALIKQRVRWTTGFLLNAKDYRRLFFSKKYGHVGMFTLPAGVLSIVMILFFTSYWMLSATQTLADNIARWNLVGFHWHWTPWQWFFMNTTIERFMIFAVLICGIFILFAGKRISSGSWKPSRDMLSYVLLYGFIAPIWIGISSYKAVRGSTPRWR